MAFKQRRPLKMNSPSRSGLKLGRMKNSGTRNQIGRQLSSDTDSTFYYNSSMGPMQMQSPSALRQMEEEMESGEVPEETTETKEQPQSGTMPGQDIISENGQFYLDEGQDQIYIEDPNGIVAKHTSEDGYVDDVDFTYELTDENYYKVTGVANVSEGDEFEEGVPGRHDNPEE